MSLVLDPALAARMSEQSRHPLVEIISQETVASIPFDGSLMGSVLNEQFPNCILHSTGRICYISSHGTTSPYYLRYRYSDAQKTEFTVVDIGIEGFARDASITEMPNGNIGIVYRITGSLRYRVINVSGGALAAGTIATFSDASNQYSGPFVIRMPDNSYLMIYTKWTSGPTYTVQKRTSPDFITWSAETQITLAGLADANRKANPYILKLAGSTELWLLFGYTEMVDVTGLELSNIYCSSSTDSGATWGTPTKLTSYTEYKQVAMHPVAAQKTSVSMHLVYDEYIGCLHMGTSTLNWGTLGNVMNIHFDEVNRKLYAVNAIGTVPANVIVVDPDSWEVIKRYDEASSPHFPVGRHVSETYGLNHMGAGQYQQLVGNAADLFNVCQCISILNGESDTIQTIYFNPNDPSCNVTGLSFEGASYVPTHSVCTSTFIDAANHRIWCIFEVGGGSAYTTLIIIGYFSLLSGSSYAFTEVVRDLYAGGWPSGEGFNLHKGMIKIYASQDTILVNYPAALGGYGAVKLYNISSGGCWKTFKDTVQTDFPHAGLTDACMVGGVVYGCSANEDPGYLYKINVASELVQKEPLSNGFGVAALKAYGTVAIDNHRLMIGTSGMGIAIFDLATNVWTVYNAINVPGIFDIGFDAYVCRYDLEEDMIYFGSTDPIEPHNLRGITAFSVYGVMKQSQYRIGTYAGGVWTWGTADNLVKGYQDYEAACLVDPAESALYAFWTQQNSTRLSAMWDKEGVELNLNDYLTLDTDIVYRRSVDGSPASLSFEVSHGHLFDVHNRNSLLCPYLAKGRRLRLRFGERISGSDYWQPMGYFLVTGQKVRYGRGEYPVMQVTAQDKSQYWIDQEVAATVLFDGKHPEEIVRDLLIANADMAEEDIILGAWAGRTPLTHQWIESDLKTILEEVLNRYGYYLRIDCNDDAVARRISDSNPLSTVYPDTTKIINFSPDDSYSSTINRVIVTGTERTEIEVLYPEERIAGLNGQVAYNTGSEDHVIWYSDDQSRKCRYPRLVVIKTSTSIGFELSGEISEQLLDVDPGERYCIINIDAPDLTEELIISLAALVGSYFLPDMVQVFGFGSSTGITIRLGSYLTALFTWTTMMILGATGSYDYEIWACPVGKVKRTVQGEANDAVHQAQVRKVITKTIQDALCYSASDCQAVADQELKVARLQRNRCSFEMAADLRNEDGDTIQILHPYSKQPLNVFVTELERVMKKSDARGNGYFLDRVEGWVLS